MYHFYLRFYFSGRPEPIVYKVDRDTAERVYDNLSELPDSFCTFPTLDGLRVGVCLGHLDLINFLWAPAAQREAPTEREERHIVALYFMGRDEPYVCDPEEPRDLYELFFRLELEDYAEDPFVEITDEDGECVAIDMRKLYLVETDEATVSAGEDEINAELEDEPPLLKVCSESKPPKKARRSRKPKKTDTKS